MYVFPYKICQRPPARQEGSSKRIQEIPCNVLRQGDTVIRQGTTTREQTAVYQTYVYRLHIGVRYYEVQLVIRFYEFYKAVLRFGL